jgi:hypothetical protein
MKTAQELFKERYTRIKEAVTHGKPDRTPVVMYIDAFAGAYRGVKMSKFSANTKFSGKVIKETLDDLKYADATEVAATTLILFAYQYLTKIKIAGRELPEGSLWQIDEHEFMKADDYDYIIENGWEKFVKKINKEILHISTFSIIKQVLALMSATKKLKKAGMPVFNGVWTSAPTDTIMTSRTMPKFISDLYRMPDKVKEAMDIFADTNIKGMRKQIRMAKPLAVFLANVRGASEFYSPKLWERFVFPYIKRIAEACAEEGVFLNMHLDSNWDRDIEYFKELPRNVCIFSTDGNTDVYKLKKTVGDRICIKGNVPASMLVLGKRDEVFNYCTKLIKDMGPTGFILGPGCGVPMNANPENVKAMISAATGK